MPEAEMPDDCLFCKVAAGDIPADVVRTSDGTIAFRDIDPQAPTHVLVIPREHHRTVSELAHHDPEVLGELVREAHLVAESEGIAESGYRVVFNSGKDAHQTVFHVHAHVLGGRPMGWPPG